MNTEKRKKRGYGLIEPPIYDAFDNDLDSIVSCLDIICSELPKILTEFPESIKYEVIPVDNPYGEPYPAIGFYSDEPKDYDMISSLYDFDEIVNNWFTKDKIEKLKAKLESHHAVSWENLKNRKPD